MLETVGLNAPTRRTSGWDAILEQVLHSPTRPAQGAEAGAAPARRSVDPAAVVRLLLQLAVLAGLVYAAASLIIAALAGRFEPLARISPPLALALAAVAYLTGHVFRLLRLALLIGGWRLGLRDIAAFHMMTAAATLASPFKLGELYRLYELSNLVGGLVRAVVISWWERVFDAVVLLLLLVLVFASGAHAGAFRGVALLIGAFVAVTAVTIFVLPDNLRRLSVLIIRRYDSPHTVPLLRLVDLVRRAILEAPRVVQNKVASLLTLSVLTWIAQVACLVIAFPTIHGDWQAAMGALLQFLSALTEGASPLGVLGAAHPPPVMMVLAATQAPLIFVGVGASLIYAWRRRRS
jgi:hypothetical protein